MPVSSEKELVYRYFGLKDSANITCGRGNELKMVIKKAEYGTSDGELNLIPRCNWKNVTRKVSTRCDGKLYCSIIGLNSLFGPPCQNIRKSATNVPYFRAYFSCDLDDTYGDQYYGKYHSCASRRSLYYQLILTVICALTYVNTNF